MALTKSAVTALVKLYWPQWVANKAEMDELDRWARGKLTDQDKPQLQNPSKEYKELRDRSHTPWLGLIVTATAQSLFVDGYRAKASPDNVVSAWATWQRNGLKARQIAVHRGAIALGHSYVSVLPGVTTGGDTMPKIRGHSARRMITFFADLDDDWPLYAMQAESTRAPNGRLVFRVSFWDDGGIHLLDYEESNQTPVTYLEYQTHEMGIVPITQFSNVRDLDGRTMGEVEAFRDIASRVDQDNFDRLVVQRFNAWLLRWIAGLELPATKVDEDGVVVPDVEANRAYKMKLAADDLLIAEDSDTKFGAFPQGQITAYVDAREADIADLAAVSQTPPHHLLGKVANLSAEALAAAEAGLTRKVTERKAGFGESWEQVFRTASVLMGEDEDFDAETRWRDTESRSLAQVADALGKLTQSLGIPPQALWERAAETLGVSQSEVQRWMQLAEASDPLASMANQITGALDDDASAELKQKFEALGIAIRAGVSAESAAAALGIEGIDFTGAIPTSLRPLADDADELEGTAGPA